MTLLRTPRASPTLMFSTTQVLIVINSALVGRNPSPDPGKSTGFLSSVDDMGRSVWRTHFRADRQDGHLAVADRGCTNGLIRHGGDTLEPGTFVGLRRGDHVAMGDHAFTVQATS